MRMNRSWQRLPFLFPAVCLSAMLWCGTGVSAQQIGRLHLYDLPTSAHVYVDGKSVPAQKGTIITTAGWHEIQVEGSVPGKGGVAYRRTVRITAGKSTDMLIVWHRVTLGLIEGGQQGYFPPGVPGPTGDIGPPARQFQPLPLNADTAALRKPMQEACDILVDDLLACMQDALNGLDKQAIQVYFYTAGGPVSVIPGNFGPVGPQGAPGLPAEVRLIQTAQGLPLQEALKKNLGLQGMELALSSLGDRIKQLSSNRDVSAVALKPFNVLTPALKAKLDSARLAELAVPRPAGILELPDIAGPVGAPGHRGPDGNPPPDAKPLLLRKEQEKDLLIALAEDKATQEKLVQLRELLRELKQRVYIAEGLHLEQLQLSAPAPH